MKPSGRSQGTRPEEEAARPLRGVIGGQTPREDERAGPRVAPGAARGDRVTGGAGTAPGGGGPRQRRATANSGPLLRPEFQPLPTPAAAKHTQGHGRHLRTLLVPPGRAKGAKLPCGY